MVYARTRDYDIVSPKDAEKGEVYFCPRCSKEVVLKEKKGKKHFEHREKSKCIYPNKLGSLKRTYDKIKRFMKKEITISPSGLFLITILLCLVFYFVLFCFITSIKSTSILPKFISLLVGIFVFMYFILKVWMIVKEGEIESSTKIHHFFLESTKLILLFLFATITAQVAFIPLISPRISFERSTDIEYGILQNRTTYVRERLYFTLRPPLFLLDGCANVKLAYVRLAKDWEDWTPLLKEPVIIYDGHGNPTILRICTNVDGWQIEDIKSSIFVEREREIALKESVDHSANSLSNSEKLSGYINSTGFEFYIYFRNKEDKKIFIRDYSVDISNKSDKGRDLWEDIKEELDKVDLAPDCIIFHSVKIKENRRYNRGLAKNYTFTKTFIKEGVVLYPTELQWEEIGVNETLKTYVHAYIVDCPRNLTLTPP